jgi:hypothetical protein
VGRKGSTKKPTRAAKRQQRRPGSKVRTR